MKRLQREPIQRDGENSVGHSPFIPPRGWVGKWTVFALLLPFLLNPDQFDFRHAENRNFEFRKAKARGGLSEESPRLAPQPESFCQLTIPCDILVAQVLEQPTPFTDQHQESTTRVVIFLVDLEMLGQIADSLREDRDLHFRGSRIAFMRGVLLDQAFFGFVRNAQRLLPIPSLFALGGGDRKIRDPSAKR